MNTKQTAAKTKAAKPKSNIRAKKPKAEKAAIPKKAPKPTGGKSEARSGSKSAIVLELMGRKQGATLAEIAKATEWQNHSIRGFVSGHVTKKMGLKVESTKNDALERIYRS